MRTLVVSDLHLGNRLRRDVLRRPAAIERLRSALATTDRLVLLGDVAELQHRRAAQSLLVAEPVLRAIGEGMAARPGAEVIFVPGNHDRPLLRPWLREHAPELGAAEEIDPRATAALAQVTGWLGPARVRVSYPGVWLDDRTYATHGHYLDRHLIPDAAIGLLRGRSLGGDQGIDRLAPWSAAGRYERPRRPGRGAVRERSLGRLATRGLELTLRRAATTLLPILPRLLRRAALPSVSASVLDLQMRRAAVPALGMVLGRLGIEADVIIFGHVHRLGPLSGDRDRRWPSGPGGAALFNPGSWLYEPLLVGRDDPRSPYWPGGAIVIDDGGCPRALNLLEGLTREQLVG